MATSTEYVQFVCSQLGDVGELHSRKMFGEYMVYLNDKPVLLVCDNTVYVKMLDCIRPLMGETEVGLPYEGAKEHYILDIEDRELCRQVVRELERAVPLPKKRATAGKRS